MINLFLWISKQGNKIISSTQQEEVGVKIFKTRRHNILTFGQTWSMILSITRQVTYKKERKVSKKMFPTEDDETKTNERIKDKYRNCILEQKSAAMYQAVLRIKPGCTAITRKT